MFKNKYLCAKTYTNLLAFLNVDNVFNIRGRPQLSSFSKEYTEYAGGGGQWSIELSFFKMLIIMHCLCIQEGH